VWLVRRRRRRETTEWIDPESRTSARRVRRNPAVWGSRRLWAIYWYLGSERYELYRAIGLGLLTVLAAIVARDRRARRADPADLAVPEPETIRDGVRSATPAAIGPPAARFGTSDRGRAGIAPNLVAVDDDELPGDPIEEVGVSGDVRRERRRPCGERRRDGGVRSIDERQHLRVIVANADREIWTTAVSKGNLAFWGYRAVDVGGTGWRETVWVQRTGWVAANGGPTYRVDAVRNETRSTLFTSEPARAEPRIDGRNVTVAAVEGGFELRVEGDGGERPRSPHPAVVNESVTLREVTFVRENNAVFAERRETRVRIAQRERYEGRQ